MQSEIGSVAFYQNVSSYPVKAPVISIDDCSGTMYCEGDYSLVVFDTDKVTMFDKYSADGFCDPYTQTWNVDKDGSGSLTTFKTLRGLCVDYSPPKTTPKPEKNCMSCPTNIENYVISSHYSEDIVHQFNELSPENGCRRMKIECFWVSNFICESILMIEYTNYSLRDITLERAQNYASTILTCDENGEYYFKDLKNISKIDCNFNNCI
ncbi:hypothetical protein CAEBREN_00282 [Caenorhabditis brenneri]|uniref:DUF281 domain-containing protein n=1 Tax=Caenorhabditis brenneri TaxID=135651 RepID=G0P5W2_CAEBE|nr:hypothetical protein CAEBREN_00282 [Caenorhabditis brenneri]